MRGRIPWGVALRSFAVQGSWNYETLTGTGFAFVILPALRRIYGETEALDAAVRRHEGTFNTHPYLAPLALGAVIRMEREGEDPLVIERFKAAVRGSFGTLGDQLVWAGWRPLCLLLALTLLLLGAPWWGAILTFLLVYNIGHVLIMTWGLAVGLREGRQVAERLRGPLVRRTQPPIIAAGAFLAGVAMSLVIVRGLPGWEGLSPVWLALAVAFAAAGVRWGERLRQLSALAVAMLALAGLVVGVAR